MRWNFSALTWKVFLKQFKDVPVNIGLVMGSDCHEWDAYPNHDHENKNESFTHSRAKNITNI